MHTIRTRRLLREVCGPDTGSMTRMDRETVMPISLVLGIVVVVLLAGGTTTGSMAQATPLPCAVMVRAENADQSGATFAAAMLAYERNHWQQAFDALADLADGGHVEAARIAGQMERFGVPLYGMNFQVRSTRLAHGPGCSGMR